METNNQQKNLKNVATYQSGVVQSSAHRALKKHTDSFLQEYGITTMQWFIIGTIYDAGSEGIRVTDLAKKIDTTLAFLTNSVNILQHKNWVVRTTSQDDSRSKRVTLTSECQKLCPIIEENLRKKLRSSLYSKITPEDLRTYIKVLYVLADLDNQS